MENPIYKDMNGVDVQSDEHAFVKIVKDKDKTFYFGLIHNGLLVNPYDRFTLNDRQRSKFKKINEVTYNQYVKFLTTKQTQYLNIARRSMN